MRSGRSSARRVGHGWQWQPCAIDSEATSDQGPVTPDGTDDRLPHSHRSLDPTVACFAFADRKIWGSW